MAASTRRGPRDPTSTAAFLRHAFEVLRDVDPARYNEVRDHLRHVPSCCRVGAEAFTLSAPDGPVSIRRGAWGLARVNIETSARNILRLVDGTSSVLELLRDDVLRIYASADALLEFGSAVRTFCAAAVGNPSLQHIFEQYRTWVIEHDIG